jgi:hypothetical protein
MSRGSARDRGRAANDAPVALCATCPAMASIAAVNRAPAGWSAACSVRRTMKLSTSLVLVLLAFAGSGCSSVVDPEGTGGQATSTSTSTSTPCGTKTCGADEFCKDISGTCGGGFSAQLSCVKIGTACSDGEQVCGCDGTIYMSEGCATLSKVNVDFGGKCAVPAGMFSCGAKYCSIGSQFCRDSTDPAANGGELTTYSCEALPASCAGAASCACLPMCDGGSGPMSCTLDAAGNATLHCTTG